MTVFPRGALGVMNSFMTKQNYRELRLHSKTKLYLPTLLLNKPYSTVLTFRIYSPLPQDVGRYNSFRCDFKLADNRTLGNIQANSICCYPTYLKEFSIGPTAGSYEAKCWMKYLHTTHFSYKHQLWRKQVEIVPFTGEREAQGALMWRTSGLAVHAGLVWPKNVNMIATVYMV